MIWYQTLVGPLARVPVMPLPIDIIETYQLHHCSICGEDKPESEFQNRNGKLRGQCNSCRYKQYKAKTIEIERPTKCAYCGGHLEQLTFGKPLKYCSTTCRDKWWIMEKKKNRVKHASR